MNRSAFYTYRVSRPNKIYGPWLSRAAAEEHAEKIKGVVTVLTGNEILRIRARVTSP